MAKFKAVVCEEMGFRQEMDGGQYTPEQVRDALSQIIPAFRNAEYEIVDDQLRFRISAGTKGF